VAINPALLVDGERPSTIRFRHWRVLLPLLLSLPSQRRGVTGAVAAQCLTPRRLDVQASPGENGSSNHGWAKLMETSTTRATIYLDSELHRAVRLKAASTGRSISELVSEAVRESLREDEEDLSVAALRAAEPAITYEAFLKKLKADGTL